MTGIGFLRRLVGEAERAAPAEERVAPDEARLPLHVLADDARLRIEEGQLMLEAGETEESLRLHEIAFVALHGGAQVSVPCLQALARASVPLILLSRSGYYLGQMVDLSANHSAVRRAQYRTADDPKRCLEVARPIVAGKIRAAARIARRRGSAKAPVVRQLDKAARSALRAGKPDELRGIEGAATAA
jgi:CRISPR-associated protein Cas1